MKKIIKMCIIFCCISFAFGCSDDERLPAVPEEPRIALFIPGADEVRVYSTATADENRIEDCFVVVFRGGSYYNMEEIEIDEITANGKASALLPQLQNFKIESGDRVYVICNTGLAAPPTGITESNINDKFPPAKAYYISGEALPMSGSTVWSSSSSTTVTLTRAVAKVQIKLGENFSMGNIYYPPPLSDIAHMNWNADFFKEHINLCGFTVCNYAGKSDILQPSPPALSQTLSDSTGLYGTFENVIRLMQYATADSMAVYVSEYPNSTMDCDGASIPDDVFDVKRQHLLMIDRIENNIAGGGDAVTGFWRLDFYDAANKKYLDIKRNHTYTFTINRIGSGPYIDYVFVPLTEYPQLCNRYGIDLDVQSLPGSNIEYTIEVKDDWANAIYSNGQYALLLSADTINDRNVNLPFKVKLYMPAGVDHSRLREGELYVVDRNGHKEYDAGAPFKVYLDGWFNNWVTLNLQTSTVFTFTFEFNPSAPGAEFYDDASMYILMGNIAKRIPIRLTVP